MLCEVETSDSVEEECRARGAQRLREIVYCLQAGNLPAEWDPSLGLAGGYQPESPVPLYLVAGICIAEGINIDRAVALNRAKELLARRYRHNSLRSFSCQLPSGQLFIARPFVVNQKPVVYITVGGETRMNIPAKSCLALTQKGYRVVQSERSSPKKPTAYSLDHGEGCEHAPDRQVEPLTKALQDVWDLLDGRSFTGKELATQLLGRPNGQEAIRKRVGAIRKTGRCIEWSSGLGYYRPDAPPPERARS